MSITNENEQEEVKPLPESILDILLERGYSLLTKIGEGSYASVYVTKYQPPGSEKETVLACKMIDTKKVPKHFAKKFLPREIAVMKKVRHPNIISVHSIFAQGTVYLIFMNYASKGDLLNFILKNGAIKERLAYRWFRQVTEAVNYLHEIGIAHRDLKCENLLLTSRYIIKLSDFGFSRFILDENGVCVKSKTYCGSISYAPPEVISGTPYDPKLSDVWSLGVILFVMLNKAMPFDDTNVKHVHECQMQQNWHFRAKIVNYLSDDVKYLMLRLLQPKIQERWTTEEILHCNWFVKNLKMSVLDADVLDEEIEDVTHDESIVMASIPAVRNLTESSSSTRILSRNLKKDTTLTVTRD